MVPDEKDGAALAKNGKTRPPIERIDLFEAVLAALRELNRTVPEGVGRFTLLLNRRLPRKGKVLVGYELQVPPKLADGCTCCGWDEDGNCIRVCCDFSKPKYVPLRDELRGKLRPVK